MIFLFIVSLSIPWNVVFIVYQTKQMLNDLSQMWLGGQLIPFEVSSLLGLISIKIRFVNSFFFLNLSELFDFIVVDHHDFVVEVLSI